MGIHKSAREQQLAVMDETLAAAELLLSFNERVQKNNPLSGIREENRYEIRLGYPAAILLFSIVEAIGHSKYPKAKNEGCFKVLKEPIFGKQDMEEGACINLYKLYRNNLVHNLVLPPQIYLTYSKTHSKLVSILPKGYKNEDTVTEINLFHLLAICKMAVATFKEGDIISALLGNLTKEIVPNITIPNHIVCPSGWCGYN